MENAMPYSVRLVDQRTGDAALYLSTFDQVGDFASARQYPCFSMLLILRGAGLAIRDGAEYEFSEPALLTFSLYQSMMIRSEGEFKGILIQFTPSFFCLFKHRQEVSCNGVLFNNLYDTPLVRLTPAEARVQVVLTEQMRTEIEGHREPDQDALISYLKVFLINASRVKIDQQKEVVEFQAAVPMAIALREAIEVHFRRIHSASGYAGLLHSTIATLNRLSKFHFGKTLTNLIADRLIIEAKRELYLTARPVKEIAFQLGYDDEFYFSRFFRKQTGISPQTFRNTIGLYSAAP
ncbi:helix-turn-helix domain-containing protein [Puia sp.]|jgi:AraC-like DNA-binding protein|uniref:helix-turn-helix domain-containing protein n=1 Tax=Puia sp. TaxID=2045100 RepID=UPI002F3FDB6F